MQPITLSEERAIESLIVAPTALAAYLRACEATELTGTGIERLMRDIDAEEEAERWDGQG